MGLAALDPVAAARAAREVLAQAALAEQAAREVLDKAGPEAPADSVKVERAERAERAEDSAEADKVVRSSCC